MTRSNPLLPAVAFIALVSGCARGPSLHYQVDFARRDSRGVPVVLEITGVPRDSLLLEGYLPASLMRLGDVVAAGNSGRPLAFTVGSRVLGDTDFPWVRLDGPLPSRLTLRYRVGLGTREGNEHTGFTGRCAGYAGERLAFAGGRSLFLVPTPPGRVRDIDVRFRTPVGWVVRTPWEQQGEARRPGARAGAAVQDLLWSPLMFGPFEERHHRINSTAFRFVFGEGLSVADKDSALRAYDAIAERVMNAFGRGLGRDFDVFIAPPTPDGDEIMLEGWGGTGVGGTLSPVTTKRAHEFAQALVDAYLAPSPHGSVVRNGGERWIEDGVRQLLPWRALEATGLSRREDLERWLAVDYARELGERDSSELEWNLEKLAASELDTRLAHETLAPLALMRVEDTVRSLTNGRDSLDTVLRRVLVAGSAKPLWSSLPHPQDRRWEALRARYVRGEGGLIDDPLFALSPPSDDPQPPRGAVASRLTLAITGNAHGLLENCGCKVNQAGGVARRATALTRLRSRGPVLALDAGNTLMHPDRFAPPDALARQEEKLYLSAMVEMDYPLAAVGPAELAYGVDRFRDATTAGGLPFVLANSAGSAGALAPPWRVTEAGGVRVGVIGLLDPEGGPWANDVLERHLGPTVRFDDPVATLRRLLPEARAKSDLVIAMGQLSPFTVRRIVSACPDLDVVISTDEDAGARVEEDGKTAIASGDPQGFHGRTLVLYATQSSFGLNGAVLGLDAERRIATAEQFATWLGDSVPDDFIMRRELTRFYERVGRTEAAQASVPPLFAGDERRVHGDYVGAARCQPCHAAEHAQWKDTPHAEAYKTLLDVHRHYQPRCVVCHVVGLGTPNGYKLGSEDLRLVGVQCEICHGPGGAHVSAPRKDNITRAVPAKVCLECHNPDHSDHFVYEERLPRVVHQQPKVIDAAGK
jgi:hypothetical protein